MQIKTYPLPSLQMTLLIGAFVCIQSTYNEEKISPFMIVQQFPEHAALMFYSPHV
jgi:hypothetical protein